jgi:hypothetical protein
MLTSINSFYSKTANFTSLAALNDMTNTDEIQGLTLIHKIYFINILWPSHQPRPATEGQQCHKEARKGR